MKIVIIEDDPMAAEFLENELKAYNPEIQIVAVINSVAESVRFFSKEHNTYLVFMDIELTDGLSFSIFERCEITSPVIFVTALNDHMSRAFSANGIAYIEKPLSREKLRKSMEKYQQLKKHMSGDIVEILKNAGVPKNKRSVIIVRKGVEFCFLRTENIVYFFSENYVVFAVDAEGRKFIVETANLSELMSELEETLFFKANRKFIVNIHYIKKYRPVDRVKLQLETTIAQNESIIVGQENAKSFKRWVKTL